MRSKAEKSKFQCFYSFFVSYTIATQQNRLSDLDSLTEVGVSQIQDITREEEALDEALESNKLEQETIEIQYRKLQVTYCHGYMSCYKIYSEVQKKVHFLSFLLYSKHIFLLRSLSHNRHPQ